MIAKKIDFFTADMKRMAISQEAEQRIETFLEELIYINPYSEFQIEQAKQEKRELLKGKIVKDSHYDENGHEDSWKML
jgi:hypothetical protein